MTQDDMDNDMLQAAARLLKTRLVVDRSRHESTTETTLWFMDGKIQRGSSHRHRDGWFVNRMWGGMPTSERFVGDLAEVVEHIVSQDPERFKQGVTRNDHRHS
jgi:hypothetical protein